MLLEVSPAESGQKLLKYLLRKTDGTKVFLYKLFRKGNIRVNGHRAGPDYIVHELDRIECTLLENYSRDSAPDSSLELSVLYRDNNIIALDKPAGIPVHPTPRGGDNLADTLARYLGKEQNCDNPYSAPLHRLDAGTAGITVFGLTYAAVKSWGEDFAAGRIRKTYQALVKGIFPGFLFLEGGIERKNSLSIVKHISTSDSAPDRSTWMAQNHDSSTASAMSASLLDFKSGISLLSIDLWTGRHHQIRAMLSAAGFPLDGDSLYGGGRGQFRLLCSRLENPGPKVVINSRQELTVSGYK